MSEVAQGSALATLPLVLDVVRAVNDRRGEHLADVLRRTLRRVAPADWFGGVIVGEEGSMAEMFIEPHVVLPSRNMEDYWGGSVMRDRRVIVFTREEVEGFPLQAALWDRLGTRAALTIPLLAEERIIGSLSYWSRDPDAYAQVDVEMLTLLGRAVGVTLDNHLAFARLEELRRQAADDHASLLDERSRHASDTLIGEHPAFKAVKAQVERVAPTTTTVLVTGETGTGKELVARAIHAASPRCDRPFVAINCAALPAALVESELFGHEQGAFTGASRRRQGRFELAHGGTLFLDEVGELPLETQAKLLRGLQERRFERVGGSETIVVDVRLVAATHRDLSTLVSERSFREDLYYRLNVFPIALPALRDRREDIPRLAEFFVERSAARLRAPLRRISAADRARLSAYDWPGNIRELENAIERAMIVSAGADLDLATILPRAIARPPVVAAPAVVPAPAPAPAGEDRDALVREQYRRALDDCQWVIEGPAGAAARLAVHPNTLRYRLKRLGLVRPGS